MAKTKLSSGGRVTIPREVRERHGWRPGTELEVEDHGGAVVLRAAWVFPRTTLAQVFGCLKYEGQLLTDRQMNTTVVREARKRR